MSANWVPYISDKEEDRAGMMKADSEHWVLSWYK